MRTSSKLLALWLLRLYPRRWRERYEAEMSWLLEEHEVRLTTLVDLLAGSLDARLDPAYVAERSAFTMRSPRFTNVMLFSAFALFSAALLPLLAVLLDGYEEAGIPTHYNDVVSAYPLLGIASSAVLMVSLVAGIGLLVTFVALAMTGIMERRRWAVLLLVPMLAVALVIFAPVLPLGSSVYVRQLMLALSGIVLGMVGVGAALARPTLRPAQWRALLTAAAATTLAIVLVAISALAWLITLWLHASQLRFTSGLNLATGAVGIVALAAIIASAALGRGLSGRVTGPTSAANAGA
ncbi:MAG: hypothetical protein ACXVCO_00480 [Ktedonobacterales bacterium]